METVETTNRPFGLRDKIGYGLGDAGCNFSFALISSFMMIFFTQFIGITLEHYAILILGTKIWDGINDPLIGAIADRVKPKNGDKFRPWIFWGSFPLAIAASLLFIDTRALSYGWRLGICIIAYLIWDIAYTVVNVPYGSMNATITADPMERSQLSTWRSVGSMVASLPIMIILPLVLYNKEVVDQQEVSIFQGQRMFSVALVLGFVALICFQLLFRFTRERIKDTKADTKKINIFKTIGSFFSNRTMLAVALTALVSIVFMTSFTTTNALVCQMYFGDGRLSSLSIIVYLPAVAVLPFVKRLTERFGKKALCTWPLLLGVIVYTMLLVLPNITPLMWVVGSGISAFSMAMYTLLGWALVTDGIDAIELKTGRREEGSVYATYSFVRKLGQAVGQWMIPFVIGAVCVGLKMDDPATWNAAYGLQIKNISVGLCLIGYILAFILLYFVYDIDKKRELEMPALLGRSAQDMDVSLESVTEGLGLRED